AGLGDDDEDVRFLAVKWIADEKLTAFRPHIEKALTDPKLNVRMYWALATALARLDGQEVNENKLADFFVQKLADPKTPAAVRLFALQLAPAKHPTLTLDFLGKLLVDADPRLRLEAVRTLIEHPSIKRAALLKDILGNSQADTAVRAHALLG